MGFKTFSKLINSFGCSPPSSQHGVLLFFSACYSHRPSVDTMWNQCVQTNSMALQGMMTIIHFTSLLYEKVVKNSTVNRWRFTLLLCAIASSAWQFNVHLFQDLCLESVFVITSPSCVPPLLSVSLPFNHSHFEGPSAWVRIASAPLIYLKCHPVCSRRPPPRRHLCVSMKSTTLVNRDDKCGGAAAVRFERCRSRGPPHSAAKLAASGATECASLRPLSRLSSSGA